jgi:hypothetical protein
VIAISEFTCENGHMPAPSKMIGGRCPECGGRIVRMDGMSNGELRMMEADDGPEPEEELEPEIDEGEE